MMFSETYFKWIEDKRLYYFNYSKLFEYDEYKTMYYPQSRTIIQKTFHSYLRWDLLYNHFKVSATQKSFTFKSRS